MNERTADVPIAAVAHLTAGVDADAPARILWTEASRSVMRSVVAQIARGRGLPTPCWGNSPAPADIGLVADLGDIASWGAVELGDVYESLLEVAPRGKTDGQLPDPRSRRRRTLGAYYTPPDVAAALARFALGIPSTAEAEGVAAETPALVLDPACGAGVVLVQAARAIAARCRPRPGLLARVIEECVFGVDVDPVAVDLARAALWLEFDGERPITWFDRNVVCGDTLAGVSPPGLEERLGGPGPLLILGNPPYRDRALRPACWPDRRRRKEAAGDVWGPDMDDFRSEDARRSAEHLGNSHVYFWRWAVWKALESRLSADGVVGLITPRAWLQSPGFGGMRRHLRRWAHFGWVVDLSPEGHQPEVATRIFPGVQIQLCLAVFARLGEPSPLPAMVRAGSVSGSREEKVAQLRRVLRRALGQPAPAGGPNDDTEVNAMKSRMIPVDRIRILEGHNARDQVGDVSDLQASIEELGVLQALTVVEIGEENGQPVYGLVAGERRLTAARGAGLTEVPCLVRGFDDRQRIAAMLVENLQRQDLSVLEEARGVRRLVDMGLSQREIGRLLGRGQSHVSKRLALLSLPEPIQAAINQPREGQDPDARGITVVEALELTKLADYPQQQMEAFANGRRGYFGGVTGAVAIALREVQAEQARAEARSRLMSSGIRILKERDYYPWTDMRERPLLGQGHDPVALRLTPGAHASEPCHAAAIDREGKVVFICADPTRHAEVDSGTAAQAERVRVEGERQRTENRLRRDAARGRREAMERVIAGASTSSLAFAARQLTSHWRVREIQVACSLLGIEPRLVDGRWGTRKTYPLNEYAGGSMTTAIRALLALALASGEEVVGSTWGGVTELGKRHMELLVQAGYEPNDSDRLQLTGTPGQRPGGQRACRYCGARQEHLEADGREWVEDPEGLGDLCSGCVAELRDEEALAEA